MTKHTPTLLMLDGRGYRTDTINGGEFVPILEVVNHGWIADARAPKENAERLVACWNAFYGEPGREIKTEKIEAGVFWAMLDELREAEGKLGMFIREHEDPGADALALQYRLSALLAKLEE